FAIGRRSYTPFLLSGEWLLRPYVAYVARCAGAHACRSRRVYDSGNVLGEIGGLGPGLSVSPAGRYVVLPVVERDSTYTVGDASALPWYARQGPDRGVARRIALYDTTSRVIRMVAGIRDARPAGSTWSPDDTRFIVAADHLYEVNARSLET